MGRNASDGNLDDALKVLINFRSRCIAWSLPQFNRRQASRGDARITRVGLWLRRTAMDEIPQLWNILKGEMSFVGPRALLPSEVEVRRAFQGDVPLDHVPGFERRDQRMSARLNGHRPGSMPPATFRAAVSFVMTFFICGGKACSPTCR